MILQRLIAASALLCLLVTPAVAQKTKAAINSEISAQFPDNTNGAITPQNLRNVTGDIVNSIMPTAPVTSGDVVCFSGTTGLLQDCGAAPVTSAVAPLAIVGNQITWPGQASVPQGGTGQSSFTAGLPIIGNGALALALGSVTGNTTKFATSSGTLTTNDCVKIDGNGNLVDSGAGCGAGSNIASTQNFVAGVGFTPGTTTSLTLSSAPTNAQQLLIAFDGMVQAHDTWSLAGAVVTFNVAIPANINVVEAQWYTSSTTAGVGSLTDQAGNVASGAVNVLPPLSTAGNTLGPGGGCLVKSRAAAILLNLTASSACSMVKTGGYATAGDGGGATFQSAGTSPFQDSFVTAGSVTTAGSGCTNGTYLGVALTGGTGVGLNGTVVISGNALSSFTISGTGGNAYTVGDQLSVPSSAGSCSVTPKWTVSAVSTPSGSFTDAGGTHWQYVVDDGNFINIRQFGAVCNWTITGGDGAATNDTISVQNALNYAALVHSTSIYNFGAVGVTVILPNCNTLLSAIQVPVGVTFSGVGRSSSFIKEADSLSASSHFITLCDPVSHLACFGARLQNVTIYAGSGSANSNISVIYSNSAQQSDVVTDVFVYPGPRVCIYWDTGFGGAASVGVSRTECSLSNTSSNPGIITNYTAAVQTFRDIIVESSGMTGTGIQVTSSGAVINIDGIHSEGITSPIFWNALSGSVMLHVENATGGSGCTSFVTRQSGSTANQIRFGSFISNGCTNAYNNAGTPTTGNLISDAVF